MIPFHTGSTMTVSAPSNSGKTTWVRRLLRHKNVMFDVTPQRVLYCYGIYQDLFTQMEEELPFITFHQGLPTGEQLQELAGQNNIVVLDDLMHLVVKSPEMELLFTRKAHHLSIFVIFITQNICQQGRNARTIALNTHILVFLRNPRESGQIQHIGRQIFPGKGKAIEEIFRDCTSVPFGYMVFDTSPMLDDRFRIRTGIFPGETLIVYIPI